VNSDPKTSIQAEGATLVYRKSGSAKKTLLLFHGFGQDHTAFDAIDTLNELYTCYSFDLFFHGQSTWANDDNPISKKINRLNPGGSSYTRS